MVPQIKFAVLAAVLSAFGSVGHAATVKTPVPDNAFITVNLLQWAWASPVSSDHPTFDPVFQAAYGWRLPSVEELVDAPQATDFVFEGANVPLGGTDPVSAARFVTPNGLLDGAAACAAPYFSSFFKRCDWLDAVAHGWAGQIGEAIGIPAEQLMVRDVIKSPVPAPVPVPAALPLLASALAALMVMARRRHATV